MRRIVGIDLGTTNSLVAYFDPQTGAAKCIPGPYGETLCPSVVSLDPDGSIIVGEPARRRLLTQPERTIYSVKRSEEHTSELQSPCNLVCRLLLEKKKKLK